MKLSIQSIVGLTLVLSSQFALSSPDATQLGVWSNEAIVTTYSYDYKNYLPQQKAIAKYFTSDGWIAYTKALNDSKLPEAVQKNEYYVSSVATFPPEITNIDPTHWKVTMPLLVIYKNPQYQQKQTLKVVLTIAETPDSGVRGLSITSLQATVSEPPCQCKAP